MREGLAPTLQLRIAHRLPVSPTSGAGASPFPPLFCFPLEPLRGSGTAIGLPMVGCPE